MSARSTSPCPRPSPDGRTGRVPAGCVFWMKAAERTFTTVAEDHGNCSVGSVTHGFKTLDEVAGNSDVAALLESGWVTMDVVPQIPVVRERPGAVTYGPLADTPVDPDVVLLRLNGRAAHGAVGRDPRACASRASRSATSSPLAKEEGEPAASVGCALSRVRTGMPPTEMTCAIPGGRVAEVIERLRGAATADQAVAAYAAQDAKRFGR